MFKNGTCNRGSKCSFAHGQSELRELPNYRKTRLCIAYTQGKCNLDGKDCKYAHGEDDMKKNNAHSSGGNNFNKEKDYRNQREEKSYNRDHRDDYRDHREREYRGDYKEKNRDHRDSDRGYERNRNKDRDQNAKYNEEIMKKYTFNPMS